MVRLSGTFLQLKWGFFVAKMGKASSESTKQWVYCNSKTLVAIGELQCESISTQRDLSNKKAMLQPLDDDGRPLEGQGMNHIRAGKMPILWKAYT